MGEPGQDSWLFAMTQSALSGKPRFISVLAKSTVLTSQWVTGLMARIDSPQSRQDTCYYRKSKVSQRRLGERKQEGAEAQSPWFEK